MRSFFSRSKPSNSNSQPASSSTPPSQGAVSKPFVNEPPPGKQKREEKERSWFASIAGGGNSKERKASASALGANDLPKERERQVSSSSTTLPRHYLSQPPETSIQKELRPQPSSSSMRSSGTRKSTGRRSFFSGNSTHQNNTNQASTLFSAFTSGGSSSNNNLAPPGEEYRSTDDGGVMGSPRNKQAGAGRDRTSMLFRLGNSGGGETSNSSGKSIAAFGGGSVSEEAPMVISNSKGGYAGSVQSGNSDGGEKKARRRSYRANGVPFSLPTSSTGHSLQTSNDEETEELRPSNDVSTKSLATRLQELAVAHGDGLLDEEEYRMLRTRLFEKYAAAPTGGGRGSGLAEGEEEVPRMGLASPPRHTSKSAPSTPSRPTPSTTAPVSPARAPSFLSTKSKKGSRLSIFRRKAEDDEPAEGDDEDGWNLVQPNRADVSSILSGRSGNGRSSTMGRKLESESPVRARSIRNHVGLSSMSLLGSPTMSNERGSSRDSIISGSTEGGSARPPPSSRSVRSSNLSPRMSALPPIASSTDPFLFAAAEKEPTSQELRTEIAEIEEEFRRVGESWEELERAAVEKWEKAGHAPGMEGRQNRRSGVGKKPSLSFISESPASSGTTTPRPLLPSASLIYSSSNDETDEATQVLRSELEDIRKRQRATEARYEKRLDYLRARLRGAVIKEKLPR